MIYKHYGKTGKKVSVIGFGGMRFQKNGDGYDYDKCAQMLIKANELGINYFDTAPSYCDGKSEIIFGHAFKHMPGQYYVSTKSMQKDGDKLRKDLETSLKRMGIEKTNFFHIWCVLNMEDYKSRLVKGGAYEAALKAKEEGLIEHITFSTHCNSTEIEIITKQGLFEGVTLGYNILNFPYRQVGLKAAYKNGLGVATMNPLGGGFIPSNPNSFEFIKETNSENVYESAIRFNGSHKEISTVLVGMDSLEHTIQNAEIGNRMQQFTESRLREIENKLSTSLNELCTGCGYCLDCPQDISIPKFLQAYNQKILGGIDEGRSALKYHWHIPIKEAANCIECGACEQKCTQHLPIIDRLREIASWSEAD